MRSQIYGILIFASYPLLGPAIALFSGRFGPSMNPFVYELVTLLWPFWAVARYEATVGTARAVGLAILLNVCTSAALGLLAGVMARNKLVLLVLFICASGALFVFQWFMAGGLAEMNYLTLPAAWLLLSVPFAVLARVRNG